MMHEIIESVSKFLPLKIDVMEWNQPTLILAGKNWRFSTMSEWRVIRNNVLIYGCEDDISPEMINAIKNTEIVAVNIQSRNAVFDPAFTFSNGDQLEVFSASYYEPWIFDFSSGIVYVASPSDPSCT